MPNGKPRANKLTPQQKERLKDPKFLISLHAARGLRKKTQK